MSIRPLSEELQVKAKKELNEVPSRIKEDLDHLKEWISRQPYAQYIKREDQWLLNHIRGCKFSLQQAKQQYNLYCVIHLTVPELFENRNPFQPAIQEILDRGIFVILPELSDVLAPRRFLVQAKNADSDTIPFARLCKVVTMIADIMVLEDDACLINGQEVVFDCQEAVYRYATQITTSVLKRVINLLQDTFATRIFGIHFINVHSDLLPILSFFRSLLSVNVQDRVHFYSKANLEILYEFIPRSSLPEEYGGNAGTMEKLSKQLKLKVESYAEWFINDSHYNLSKAELGMLKANLENTDVEESFKKLVTN